MAGARDPITKRRAETVTCCPSRACLFCPSTCSRNSKAPPFRTRAASLDIHHKRRACSCACRSNMLREAVRHSANLRRLVVARCSILSSTHFRSRGRIMDVRCCLWPSFLSGPFHVVRLHAGETATPFAGYAEVGCSDVILIPRLAG